MLNVFRHKWIQCGTDQEFSFIVRGKTVLILSIMKIKMTVQPY